MVDVKFHPLISLPDNFYEGYKTMCRVTPASQSFYASLGYSILSQICRLKDINIEKPLTDELNSLFQEGINSLYCEDSLRNSASYFSQILNYAYNKDIIAYEN